MHSTWLDVLGLLSHYCFSAFSAQLFNGHPSLHWAPRVNCNPRQYTGCNFNFWRYTWAAQCIWYSFYCFYSQKFKPPKPRFQPFLKVWNKIVQMHTFEIQYSEMCIKRTPLENAWVSTTTGCPFIKVPTEHVLLCVKENHSNECWTLFRLFFKLQVFLSICLSKMDWKLFEVSYTDWYCKVHVIKLEEKYLKQTQPTQIWDRSRM